MSDQLRWIYGETNPVVAAVEPDTVIEIGDLLWLDGHHARPASVMPVGGADLTFASLFLGVAIQHSVVGDVTPIRVATTGVFEFGCPAGAWELGDLVGMVYDGEKDVVCNQRIWRANASSQAIARVARREPTPTDTVLVDIRSTIMTGGIK